MRPWLKGAHPGSLGRPPHWVGRPNGRGSGSGARPKSLAIGGYRKIKRALCYCAPVTRMPAGSVQGHKGHAVRNRGRWGDERGQDGDRSAWAMPERNPAGRVMTPRTPATRMRWNGAAFGMLAVALDALSTERRALGRNPSGGNGLDGPSAARALRSVRTARGYDGAVPDPRSWHPQIGGLSVCESRSLG